MDWREYVEWRCEEAFAEADREFAAWLRSRFVGEGTNPDVRGLLDRGIAQLRPGVVDHPDRGMGRLAPGTLEHPDRGMGQL